MLAIGQRVSPWIVCKAVFSVTQEEEEVESRILGHISTDQFEPFRQCNYTNDEVCNFDHVFGVSCTSSGALPKPNLALYSVCIDISSSFSQLNFLEVRHHGRETYLSTGSQFVTTLEV